MTKYCQFIQAQSKKAFLFQSGKKFEHAPEIKRAREK